MELRSGVMAKQVRTDFPWVADISGWQWQTTRHTHTEFGGSPPTGRVSSPLASWSTTRMGIHLTVGRYTDDQSEGAALGHVARARTAA